MNSKQTSLFSFITDVHQVLDAQDGQDGHMAAPGKWNMFLEVIRGTAAEQFLLYVHYLLLQKMTTADAEAEVKLWTKPTGGAVLNPLLRLLLQILFDYCVGQTLCSSGQ